MGWLSSFSGGGSSKVSTSIVLPAGTFISFQTNPASTGLIRFPSPNGVSYVGIAFRNNANTADICAMGISSANRMTLGFPIGSEGSPVDILYNVTTSHQLYVAGTLCFNVAAAAIDLARSLIRIPEAQTTAIFGYQAKSTDVVTNLFTIRGQDAMQSGAPVNADGGRLRLQGGRARTDGTTGVRGGIDFQLSSAGVTMAELTELGVGRRVLAFCRGTTLLSTDAPTGDLIMYLGNCATAPTSNPVNGGILYVLAGALRYRGSAGSDQVLCPA